MALVELHRALEVRCLEEPDIAAEGPRPDPGADPVIDRVTQYRSGHQEEHQQRQLEGTQRRECPRCKQQRVPRQQRQDHQARLAEDNDEQDSVRTGAEAGDDLAKVDVEMDEEVYEVPDRVHGLGSGEMVGRRVLVAVPAVLADERHEPGICEAGELDSVLGAPHQGQDLMIPVANGNHQPSARHQLAHQRFGHVRRGG